jgi:hypothetical protein
LGFQTPIIVIGQIFEKYGSLGATAVRF